MPPATARPGHVRIDTRMPGTGMPVCLAADGPVATWVAAAGEHFPPLAEGIARLKRDAPAGLLVGLLPYPAPPSVGAGNGPGTTPPTLMLFDRYQRSDLPGATAAGPADRQPGFRLIERFAPDRDADHYIAGVRRVQAYLAAGDAYQVNLAQRFSARYRGYPEVAWEALRARFAPPFAAFIDLGDRQVLSLSPETFLEVSGDQVLTRPIKGTRPRHADPAIDAALASDLATHPKDRAENLMIVDLLRNDLGRVCEAGSVRAPELFRVESYRNVHHLVSTVTGTLRGDCGIPELLAACFPGGSITGAPKRRAMEIIAELEPHPRDAYCGSVFWLTADGTFGSNIAIRTFVACDGVLHGWAGAGIVADSSPAGEHQECLDKLAPLMRTLEDGFL